MDGEIEESRSLWMAYRERFGKDPALLPPGEFLRVVNPEVYQSWNPFFVIVLTPLVVAAETGYVTDNLRLGLHQAADTSDRAFRTLESGQELEIVSRNRNYAQVMLPDGTGRRRGVAPARRVHLLRRSPRSSGGDRRRTEG